MPIATHSAQRRECRTAGVCANIPIVRASAILSLSLTTSNRTHTSSYGNFSRFELERYIFRGLFMFWFSCVLVHTHTVRKTSNILFLVWVRNWVGLLQQSCRPNRRFCLRIKWSKIHASCFPRSAFGDFWIQSSARKVNFVSSDFPATFWMRGRSFPDCLSVLLSQCCLRNTNSRFN